MALVRCRIDQSSRHILCSASSDLMAAALSVSQKKQATAITKGLLSISCSRREATIEGAQVISKCVLSRMVVAEATCVLVADVTLGATPCLGAFGVPLKLAVTGFVPAHRITSWYVSCD